MELKIEVTGTAEQTELQVLHWDEWIGQIDGENAGEFLRRLRNLVELYQ